MTLANQRVQVAHPTYENSLAMGIVGRAYFAVGGSKVLGMYAIDPDDPDELRIVEGLLFSEAELEELLG